MRRREFIAGLGCTPAVAAFSSICACNAFAADTHWSYEGHGGPNEWAELDAANAACSVGTQQSPINIVDPIRATLPPLGINWSKRADTIVNNGHTIQVNVADGSRLIAPGGEYKLVQFHFHHPSEHQINGKTYPMEVHFVHANAAGALAVVGVLIENGRANAVFDKVVSTMPVTEGSPVKVDAEINPNGLLPPKLTYYRYSGSLTTPPCSEDVDWLLLTHPIQASADSVAAFAKLYQDDARPVQKSNRRFVLRSG
ncbi:carbonic anhydrase [Rhizobium jaguaris]|uniref:carbonic anhydrase n=1 Tax=Rhizobium jaguaris TaxID=1312183 RepID=UPI0039BEE16B